MCASLLLGAISVISRSRLRKIQSDIASEAFPARRFPLLITAAEVRREAHGTEALTGAAVRFRQLGDHGGYALAHDLLLQQLHVETERLQLADENVEGLGQTRIVRDLALDDRFVDLRAPFHVIRLRREQ